ncbi:hypothetical protein CDAR_420151 [Caerostris darwini]|uniref:Uncharacterized protein n=1 Tax=Caerostris darwini TaxID=1538125 RepID=A0AAV4M3J2_9ARAC|nr:hypothetical protein CDAR_420151 [Caerostris darwini]
MSLACAGAHLSKPLSTLTPPLTTEQKSLPTKTVHCFLIPNTDILQQTRCHPLTLNLFRPPARALLAEQIALPPLVPIKTPFVSEQSSAGSVIQSNKTRVPKIYLMGFWRV